VIIQTTDEDKSKENDENNSSLKLVMNNTFEGLMHTSESEIRFRIAQILFT